MRTWWGERATRHMLDQHGVTTAQADEAVADPDAIWYDPGPASKSGLSTRIVGYSTSRREVLCVIALRDGADLVGINGWAANSTYRRIYSEGT